MGDTERSPHISLEIDQEIFIDSVQDEDVIGDATVATEVTSFDRVGDAYVLEGAIVFAGFMDRNNSTDTAGGVYEEEFVDALSVSDGALGAEQLHHRVPFVLRVPVKSQTRGIVNVASRISDWKLEVISAGWIRILGDLTIVGLSGSQGYHFQCGAQEDGDLFFKDTVETVEIEAPPAFEPRGEYEPVQDATDEADEDIVAANHEDSEVPEVEYATQSDEPLGQADLKRLDRVFEEPAVHSPDVAAFEFEDQVSDLTEPVPLGRPTQDESTFQPSQSFSEEGFRAAFVKPTVHVGVEAQPSREAAEETGYRSADDVEDGETANDVRSDDVISIRDSMWSFVDFDGPESKYTLRYVIVDREASLDDLADHYGCKKSELVRANRIAPDTVVHPGQSLAVPDER